MKNIQYPLPQFNFDLVLIYIFPLTALGHTNFFISSTVTVRVNGINEHFFFTIITGKSNNDPVKPMAGKILFTLQ